jgi:hypothetical protein
LTSIAAGSTIQLQGTIAYQTPLIANNMPVPVVYKYADFVQDLGGNVIFSGDGYAPQGRFEVGQSSNAPAFIVNQRGTADIVQIKRTNDVRVVVDVNGNVGIGTTTPVGKLQVVGNLVLDGGNVGIGTAVPLQKLHVVGNLVLDGGNVGIGLTNPMSKLVVSGASTFQGNTTIGNDSVANQHSIQGYMYQTYNGTQTAFVVNQKSTGKIFELQDFSVPVLTVIDGGNVGIGTTMPLAKLHVLGNIISTDQIIAQDTRILATSSLNDTNAALQTTNGAFLSIEAFNQANSIKRPVSINAYGGNVGIGTTQPLAKLHVNGSLYAPGCVVQFQGKNQSLSASTSSTSFVASGLSINITPKFSTSKMFVHFAGTGFMVDANNGLGVSIHRKIGTGSMINVYSGSVFGLAGAHDMQGYVNATSIHSRYVVSFIDTPNTPLDITYEVYIKSYTAGLVYFGNGGHSPVDIHVFEIAV